MRRLRVLPLILFVPTIEAWKNDGHIIIGDLAWKLLSSDMQESIRGILNREEFFYSRETGQLCSGFFKEGCTPLGAVSRWADYVKPRFGEEGPSQALKVRGNGTTEVIDFERDCPGGDCVTGWILKICSAMRDQESRRQLILGDFFANLGCWFFGSCGQPDHERENLMFLTHLIGDLHCPGHVARKSDGQGVDIDVTFFNYYWEDAFLAPITCRMPFFIRYPMNCELNLHALFDESILRKHKDDDFGGSRNALMLDLYETYIKGGENNATWLSCFSDDPLDDFQELLDGCLKEWAQESFGLALAFMYPNVDGTEIEDWTDVGEDYYLRALPVVRERLAQGGVRFAALLERMLEV